MGNSFQIYDAIATTIDRIQQNKKDDDKDNDNKENDNDNHEKRLELLTPSRKYYKTKRKKNRWIF